MKKYRDLFYINHILDAIKDIEESVKSISKDKFIFSKDIRDANIRRIEIIGEAAKNVSKSLKTRYNEIEWNKIAATRDKMVHHYFGVDLDIVWGIIKGDLPGLKNKIQKIKERLQ